MNSKYTQHNKTQQTNNIDIPFINEKLIISFSIVLDLLLDLSVAYNCH